MINYKQKLHQVKAIILDVDGVLTDNSVFLSPEGSMCRTMNVKDGYAMQYALKQGLLLAVITGGKDEQVKKRLQYLGITDIYLGSNDKVSDLTDFLLSNDLLNEDTLYVGDDIPDFEVMRQCGISVCPKDAVPEIKSIADYVSPYKGGKGCVRDIIEQVLKVQNKWHTDTEISSS